MVDALCSGRSVRKDVLVRIQSRAQTHFLSGFFYGGNPMLVRVLKVFGFLWFIGLITNASYFGWAFNTNQFYYFTREDFKMHQLQTTQIQFQFL